MKKENWIWMPHPAHFICSPECRFVLATYVGKYIVSTVGELWPCKEVRAIKARVRGIEIAGKGDAWDADYFNKIGYDTLGYDRLYETMVFKAEKSKKDPCCPWKIVSGSCIDFHPYNKPKDAREGHMRLCLKWSKK